MGISRHPVRLKRYTDAALVRAPLIIGAAMLMRVETRCRLFGYPGFAMLFFLAAAGGGLWLAFTIPSSDRSAGPMR